jgi:hypothetical protein
VLLLGQLVITSYQIIFAPYRKLESRIAHLSK